jgi:hypothetical protein
MIELAFMLITVCGMLAAFYLGARKGEEKIINRKYEPEEMDVLPEVTEEEYMKSIGAWKPDAEEANN